MIFAVLAITISKFIVRKLRVQAFQWNIDGNLSETINFIGDSFWIFPKFIGMFTERKFSASKNATKHISLYSFRMPPCPCVSLKISPQIRSGISPKTPSWKWFTSLPRNSFPNFSWNSLRDFYRMFLPGLLHEFMLNIQRFVMKFL